MNSEVFVPLHWPFQSPFAILLAAILLVALVAAVTKRILLPMLGIEWPFRPVRIPWRFSLLSVTVLIVVTAAVLGLLREAPDAAVASVVVVFGVWLTVVRYMWFRQSLADRTNRQFSEALQAQREDERAE
jgi:hypothetical protein